jgi:menaquinone-dependent protoporphyrinogen IX oxidase
MKVLVCAATKYGATGEIAQAVADALAAKGLEVTVLPPEKVDAIEEFGAVVLGSAVYMGQWLKPARELAERSAAALATRPVWLFSSGPVGEPAKPASNPVDVTKIVHATKARDHQIFTGKLARKHLSFLDGHWYEIDAHYLQTHHAHVARLLNIPPSLDLPRWDTTWAERDYNDWVPLNRAGYVCLDRRGIRGGLHRHSGAEVCDLLAPGDELVHVKRAHGSAPLSHLFSQGLVAAEALLCSPDLRARFAAEVQERGKGRTVPLDFTPKKIVFAILLKDGELLTPETLFPFSHVTLAHTARTLERRGIAVEVIGINTIGQR